MLNFISQSPTLLKQNFYFKLSVGIWFAQTISKLSPHYWRFNVYFLHLLYSCDAIGGAVILIICLLSGVFYLLLGVKNPCKFINILIAYNTKFTCICNN